MSGSQPSVEFDCARCLTICLIVDGKPVAKASAW